MPRSRRAHLTGLEHRDAQARVLKDRRRQSRDSRADHGDVDIDRVVERRRNRNGRSW